MNLVRVMQLVSMASLDILMTVMTSALPHSRPPVECIFYVGRRDCGRLETGSVFVSSCFSQPGSVGFISRN